MRDIPSPRRQFESTAADCGVASHNESKVQMAMHRGNGRDVVTGTAPLASYGQSAFQRETAAVRDAATGSLGPENAISHGPSRYSHVKRSRPSCLAAPAGLAKTQWRP